MKSTLSLTLLTTGLLIFLCNGHANGHKHSHTETINGKTVIYKECSSHTKSQKLMEQNEDYRIKHEETRKHAKEFISLMRQNKDRSFNKDVSPFKQGETFDKLNNNNKNFKKRQLLDYDTEYSTAPVIRIPLVYHVMYTTARENLPQAQLESQTTVLNEDFRALNSEISGGEVDSIWEDRIGDTKLEFYTNATIRVQITDRSVCTGDAEEFKLSSAGGSDAWDPKYYLNVWICNISSAGLLGYAYQPCLLDLTNEWQDGLVLGSDNVGSINHDDGTFVFGNSIYNLGRTGTHEIGHYLNLDHIWGTDSTDSCDDDDDIDDTPIQYGANYGCPADTTNSCTSTDSDTGTDLRDMYENYMDYSNDECMFIFTEEQAWEMRSVVSGTGCRREMYYQGVQLGVGQTLMPSSERPYGVSSTCNDGCEIPEDYVNDGYCDCSECEDESQWTCESCSIQYSATVSCAQTCGDLAIPACDGIPSKANGMFVISFYSLLIVTIASLYTY